MSFTVSGGAVAIVDSYSTGSVLGRELSQRGVRCVHVRSTTEIPLFFSRTFRPENYVIDIDSRHTDLRLVVEQLAALDVRHVISGSEAGVICADILSDRLGLDGNDIALVNTRRDKSEMARVVRAAGLATPLGEEFGTVDAAVSWYRETLGGEAVVKPVDSAGSDQVRFCGNAAEVREACALILAGRNIYDTPNRTVLVQERLFGTEFYINSVSESGVHRMAEIWRYTKRLGPAGTPVYDYEEPVDLSSPEAAVLREFVCEVLDALGVRYYAAHTEVMLTERGPVLIECGVRLGGGTIPDTVEKLTGMSQTALLARILLSPGSLTEFDERQVVIDAAVRNVALINPAPITEQAGDWADRIAELPTAVGVAGVPASGEPLPQTVDLVTSPGFVYLASSDPLEVLRDYRRLRDLEVNGLYGR
ncbi:ATP-grasp domain-containing protein [Microbispora sp. RL4-1S]|uniref:ATP-grasp domain-containing protein n=1 Tax=Microbispora oryzae TaxID=2806554 RepID=A0A941AJW7_9ACTN|nr:ATP-grasp domain-containing protein [Microbispora oryzae]MBP2705462.1 ATP-grasp domain-containing protein [Microbispora oryzae]